MNLVALPAFADNYIWLLHDGAQAAVVDPGDATPVLEALDRLHLRLAAILVTHHHGDHVGGIAALRPRLQGPVYGPAREDIEPPLQRLHDGEQIEVLGLHFSIIDVPGHTAGHIAYAQLGQPQDGQGPLLFCGDTLFSAGCGRLFEGSAAQMHASLARLRALPEQTQVCCAHEYTLANLRFAAAVEPENACVHRHIRHCQALREQGLPTLPSTLALELRINPFLRCSEPGVIAAARAQGAAGSAPADVFAALREWKNRF